MTQLAHIADRVLNRPLMILPDKLSLIASVLEGRIGIDAAGLKPEGENVLDASRHVGAFEEGADGKRKTYRVTSEGVAVIPIIGSLVNRGGFLNAVSGITSYENLKFQIAAAAKDDAVKAIILDMDSPGGEAVGAFETADVVRAAAAIKPVHAMATGLCCSAAYAIASAATKIITSKSSVIGSIGVVLLHADYSHALHERGVVPTLISAGKHKTDGTPYKPLTDDVKANLKAEVEKFNSLFVATVAEGRFALTAEAILAMEAGTYIGADAVAVGLADAVGSFEGVLADLSGQMAATLTSKTRSRLMNDKTTVPMADHETALAALRTEYNTSAAATKTAHDAALAAARTEAATAERDRVKAITGLEEAKGRSSAALHLALSSDMSADAAKAILGGLPVDAAGGNRAGNSGLGLALNEQSGASLETVSAGWDAALTRRGMTLPGQK